MISKAGNGNNNGIGKIGPRPPIRIISYPDALKSLTRKQCLLKFWAGNILCPGKIDLKTHNFTENKMINELFKAATREGVSRLDIEELKTVIARIANIYDFFGVPLKNWTIDITGILSELKAKYPETSVQRLKDKIFMECLGEFIERTSKECLSKYYPSGTLPVQASAPSQSKATADFSIQSDQEINKIKSLASNLQLMLSDNKIDQAVKIIEKESELVVSSAIKLVIKDANLLDKNMKINLLKHVKDVLSAIETSVSPFHETPAFYYLCAKINCHINKAQGYVQVNWQSIFNDLSRALKEIELISRKAGQHLLNISYTHPLSGEIYFLLGQIYEESNNNLDAKSNYEEALKNTEESSPLYHEIKAALHGLDNK